MSEGRRRVRLLLGTDDPRALLGLDPGAFDVQVSGSLRQVVDQVSERRPDLIILDESILDPAGDASRLDQVAPGIPIVIRRQLSEAGATEQWRSALLDVLSDEILTPVTILNGVVQVLSLRPDLPAVRGAELARSAHHASVRLRRLLENVLLAADFQAAHVRPDLRPSAVSALISRAVDRLPPEAVVRVSVSADEVTVLVDADLASKAVAAALENALEYTSGGQIDVSVHRTADAVEIAVVDRGTGIPDEISASAFDPFVQGHAGDNRSHRGLGLGLYLMRSIMELHGGRIEVRGGEGAEHAVVLCFPTGARDPRAS